MNERQIIDTIAALAGPADGRLLKGIGDDCAVIASDSGRAWLLTMDTLIEGVHFDAAFHPPELLGRKAVSVNVSDIAAMGGTPCFALLSAGLPPGFDPAWFTAFGRGLAGACADYGCRIIGGDTVASPAGYNFSLTLIGESLAEQVLYRSSARVGDTIWVSGDLGLAAAGLALLSNRLGADDPAFDRLRAKHLDPQIVAEEVLDRDCGAGAVADFGRDGSASQCAVVGFGIHIGDPETQRPFALRLCQCCMGQTQGEYRRRDQQVVFHDVPFNLMHSAGFCFSARPGFDLRQNRRNERATAARWRGHRPGFHDARNIRAAAERTGFVSKGICNA